MLIDPDNFFALQLYDAIQEERCLVLVFPKIGSRANRRTLGR
jgi:hypothetical protein